MEVEKDSESSDATDVWGNSDSEEASEGNIGHPQTEKAQTDAVEVEKDAENSDASDVWGNSDSEEAKEGNIGHAQTEKAQTDEEQNVEEAMPGNLDLQDENEWGNSDTEEANEINDKEISSEGEDDKLWETINSTIQLKKRPQTTDEQNVEEAMSDNPDLQDENEWGKSDTKEVREINEKESSSEGEDDKLWERINSTIQLKKKPRTTGSLEAEEKWDLELKPSTAKAHALSVVVAGKTPFNESPQAGSTKSSANEEKPMLWESSDLNDGSDKNSESDEEPDSPRDNIEEETDSDHSSEISERDVDELENEFQAFQRPKKRLPEGVNARVGISLRRGKKHITSSLSKQLAGKKRKKRGFGKRQGPNKLPPEVQNLVGEANSAYILGNHSKAIDLLSEVVRISPALPDPYHTLGLIYEDLGHDPQRAMKFFMIAAHLTSRIRAGAAWKKVAHMAYELGNKKTAIYAYGRASSALPKDLQCSRDYVALLLEDLEQKEKKYNIWKQNQELKEAGTQKNVETFKEQNDEDISDFEEIEGESSIERRKRRVIWLRSNPPVLLRQTKWGVVRALAELVRRHPDQYDAYFDIERRCLELGEKRCRAFNADKVLVQCFSRCLLWCFGKKHTPTIVRMDAIPMAKMKKSGSGNLEPALAAATWLVNFHEKTKQFEKVIAVVTACNNFLESKRQENPENQEAYFLPINLLARFCQAKIMLQSFDEAEIGVNYLMIQDSEATSEMLLDIGRACISADNMTRALKIFQHLQQLEHGKTSPRVWYDGGRAHEKAKLLDTALKQYEEAVTIAPCYPFALIAYSMLARKMGEKFTLKALGLLATGVKHAVSVPSSSQAFFHATKKEMLDVQEIVPLIWEWANLSKTKAKLKNFIATALVLVERLCTSRMLMNSKSDPHMKTSHWLALTEVGFKGYVSRDWMNPLQEKVAHYLDQLPSTFSVLNLVGSQTNWYRMLLSVARALNGWGRCEDAMKLVDLVLRKSTQLISSAQEKELREFSSEMLKEADVSVFNVHRAILRQLKATPSDRNLWNKLCHVCHLQGSYKFVISKSCISLAKISPETAEPILCLAYGLLGKREFHRGLQYLLAAQRLAPEQPVIPLMLGCTVMSLLTHRDTFNRHQCLFRAVAFLMKYSKLREQHARIFQNDSVKLQIEDQEHKTGQFSSTTALQDCTGFDPDRNCNTLNIPLAHIEQEVAYNIGRCFHHSSLYHIACEYYQKALHIYDTQIEGKTESIPHVTMEAAYNLTKIYERSQSDVLVMNLMTRYLTI